MCYQIVVRTFEISLRETFSNSISFRLMKKYDKRDAVLISAVFGTINMVTV